MSKARVENLLTGARIPFTSSRGHPGYWYFSAQGKYRGEIDSPSGPITDSGRWWVEADGLVCRQYDHWRGGQKSCVYLRPEGSKYRTLTADGKPRDDSWRVTR